MIVFQTCWATLISRNPGKIPRMEGPEPGPGLPVKIQIKTLHLLAVFEELFFSERESWARSPAVSNMFSFTQQRPSSWQLFSVHFLSSQVKIGHDRRDKIGDKCGAKYSFSSLLTSFSWASARSWAEAVLYSCSFFHWYLNAEMFDSITLGRWGRIGLWLVESDHVTWILASDWLRQGAQSKGRTPSEKRCNGDYITAYTSLTLPGSSEPEGDELQLAMKTKNKLLTIYGARVDVS